MGWTGGSPGLVSGGGFECAWLGPLPIGAGAAGPAWYALLCDPVVHILLPPTHEPTQAHRRREMKSVYLPNADLQALGDVPPSQKFVHRLSL